MPRALATVETITELAPIPDADAILRARIRGWDVVVRKGEFAEGDRCVYVEIDSLLDVEDPRFAFLAPRGVRVDAEGRKGHVLRTAKLRGQYSQGLALPIADFPEAEGHDIEDDLTEALGIVVYEAPLSASLSGQAIGMRPIWVPKTDEERVQNRADLLALRDLEWVATEKIDGSSMSAYIQPEGAVLAGVCSRNLDLIEQVGNTFWELARKHDLHERLRATYPGVRAVIQGEAFGEGIQKNPLKVRGHHFAVFALVVDGVRVPRTEWPEWVAALSVPVYTGWHLPENVDAALAQVDGVESLASPAHRAEGVVWSSGIESFKVISNRYLLKHDV